MTNVRHDHCGKAEEILSRVMAILSESSYSEVSMQDIADACGVTKPTIYYHFRSKRDLFTELAGMVGRKVALIVEAETGLDCPVSESLSRIADRIYGMYAADGSFARTHIAFHTDPGLRNLLPVLERDMLELAGLVEKLVERGIESGEIRSDVSAAVICSVYCSVLHTSLAQLAESGERGGAPDPADLVRILMQGIGS